MDLPKGTLSIVADAQDGDELAITEMFNIVREYHMNRLIQRYKGRNVLVSDAEIESEFLLGVWMALPKAKLDVGNPISYMCYKGQRRVQSLFRNRIRRETRYQCLECSHTGIMGWKARVPVCTECQSNDIHTWMVENADVVDDDVSLVDMSVGVSAETAWQLAVYGIQIEEMRARLNGRALELFDILVLEGINRDSSKNYLLEIATRWGTSTMRVNIALRIVRREIALYVSEQE